uniref:Rab-like protein 3 n=1 Tax=Sus scrofa TaxID=9823 RepID=A0A8D1SS98_PIG
MPNLREPVSLTIFSLPVKLIKWLVWYEHSSNNHMLYILLLHILPYFCHNRFQRVFYMTRVLVSFTGVGKSSLVHLLCQNQVLGNPSWTVGCSVDVRVHDYKEGTPEEKTYYIELWDVGGSVGSASSVKSTRAVFYNSVNGIILVHDLTNKKSSQNLYRWSLEALNRDLVPTGVLVTNGDYDREQFADNQIPLLVIGTKLDQIHETKRHEVLTRTAFLAEDFNAEEINLDCTNPRYLAAGSSNAVKLSRFFDKVMASVKLFLNLICIL